MASPRSPFKPSFGVSPPLLVGRSKLVDEIVEALDTGPGAPGRATLYTGSRGTGKTLMLNAVEDAARRQGWIAVSETASPGFVSRIQQEHLPKVVSELGSAGGGKRITGVTAPMGPGGVTWSISDAPSVVGLRSQLAHVCDLLSANGAGLLITLDELHAGNIDDLREFATAFQHLIREEKEIAFVGAGLQGTVSEILNDDVLTFLRRADRHPLGSVPLAEVAKAISEPVLAAGRGIGPVALRVAAEATGGYPFMIQLVGHHAWRQSPHESEITLADVKAGIVAARRRLGALVHEPALADLSAVDRTFLLAMAHDSGPSSVGQVAQRMGVKSDYAGQYRRRLIEAGMIASVGYGKVDFVLPYLRDYLREHGALEAQADGADI